MATRGRANTLSCAAPQAAAAAIWAADDARAPRQDHFSRSSLGSHGDDVLAGRDAAAWVRAKRVAVTLNVLHHDHAIGAGGHRRPGHDFDRLAGADFDPNWPRRRESDPIDLESQAACKVGRAAGKSVAGGAGKRRLVPVGMNRLRPAPCPEFRAARADCGGCAGASRSACSRTIRLASA